MPIKDFGDARSTEIARLDPDAFGRLAGNIVARSHRGEHGGQVVEPLRLDMDQPIGMKTRQPQRGREQVAPAQAPEDRPRRPRQNPGEEYRRGGVVREIRAPGDLMQRTPGDAAARQMAIERGQAEGDGGVARSDPLDPGDTRP